MIGAALILTSPWLGYWTPVPLVIVSVFFKLAERITLNARRPEYPIFAAWVGSEVMTASVIALTGGPRSPAIAWLALPVVTLGARFSTRGMVAGVGIALSLLLAVGLAVDPGAVLAQPPLLIAPAALMVAIAMLSVALMRSDVEHRIDAVVDPLTGMLNRKALASRVHELTEQAAIERAPVGVVVCDLDGFKQVNDEHGHIRGDAVLRDIAGLMRKRLRAYDHAYRLGGEEFLILVPGGGLRESAQLAEDLRHSITQQTVGDGLSVTMSCGVSALSGESEDFDFDRALAEADAALYQAKRLGRDRVCIGPAAALIAVPAA